MHNKGRMRKSFSGTVQHFVAVDLTEITGLATPYVTHGTRNERPDWGVIAQCGDSVRLGQRDHGLPMYNE
jgi:hypothetical protein